MIEAEANDLLIKKMIRRRAHTHTRARILKIKIIESKKKVNYFL